MKILSALPDVARAFCCLLLAAALSATAAETKVSDALGTNASEATLIRRAESGSARDMTVLGMRYVMGRGVAADDAKGQKWLEKAAARGDAVAQVALAAMLSFESDAQDIPAAVAWYRKAAAQGNTQALYELVNLLESGRAGTIAQDEMVTLRNELEHKTGELGLEKAWRSAAMGAQKWQLAKVEPAGVSRRSVAKNVSTPEYGSLSLDVKAVGVAVNKGSPVAKSVGAVLLATGNGVTKDEQLAADWLKESAEAGYAYAQIAYAKLLASGWGPIARDEQAAAVWMYKAAVQGVADAKRQYGAMLSSGTGTGESRQEGSRWIEEAANEGDAPAQLMMAMNTVGENREEAARWFYRAAEGGDDEILSMLGVLYGGGRAAVAGEGEKMTEVRRYAQRGEPEAQLMLGLLYQEGWGIKRNPGAAENWFGVALGQQNSDALLPLGLLYAETGRTAQAAEAFEKACEQNALSFARDEGILQLIFSDTDASGETGRDTASVRDAGKRNEKPDFSDRQSIYRATDDRRSDASSEDERSQRISVRIAFLKAASDRGNPAAETILATLLEKGWGIQSDVGKSSVLKERAKAKICRLAKKRGEADPECTTD